MSESPLVVQRDSLDIPNPQTPGRNTYNDIPQRSRRLTGTSQLIVVLSAMAFLGVVLYKLSSWLDGLWYDHPVLHTLALGGLITLGLALVLGGVLGVLALALRLFLTQLPGEQPAFFWQLNRMDMDGALALWRSVQSLDAANPGRVMTTQNTTMHYGSGTQRSPQDVPPLPGTPQALAGTSPRSSSGNALLDVVLAGEANRSGLSVFIGHDETGQAQYVDFRKVYTLAVAGSPGSGKSTTARLITSQLAMLPDAAGLVVCDPHGEAHPDSLAISLSGLQRAMLCPPAIDRAAIMAAIIRLQKALEARLKVDRADWSPLVLVVDEFTSMALEKSAWSNRLIKALMDMQIQYRKVGYRAILIGQAWSANLTGGTDFRDQIGGCIIHAINPNQAAFLLPNSQEAKRAEGLQPQSGQALYKGEFATPVKAIMVPYISKQDIESAAVQARIRNAPIVNDYAAPSPRQAMLDSFRQKAEQTADRQERFRIAISMAITGWAAKDIAYGARISDEAAGKIAARYGRKP